MSKCVLPFEDSVVWNLLQQNERQHFNIKIASSISNLKDKFLIYVSNLGLDIDFDPNELTYGDKCDLFDQYLKLNRVFSCKILDHTLLHVICTSRGIDCKSFSMFNNTQAEEYIAQHQNLIENINVFVDSSLLYLAYQMQLNKLIDQQPLSELYPVVDDPHFVPQVVVNLFGFEQSIVLFSTIEQDRIKYLKPQFENAMFSGEYLNKYLLSSNNYFAAFFDDIISLEEIK